MIVDACYEAYRDAGIEDPQRQIEAVFCGSLYPSRGTAEVAESLKLFDRPVSLVQNYCASGTDAFRYGVFGVACGLYETVLVVGFDKPKDRGVSWPERGPVQSARFADDARGLVFAVRRPLLRNVWRVPRGSRPDRGKKITKTGRSPKRACSKKRVTVDDVLGARNDLVAVRPLRLCGPI